MEPPSTAGAWRSSYATRLWELAATAEPDPALAGPSGHLTLIEPGLDEDW